MFRIDHASAIDTLPAPTPLGKPVGYFFGGDPATNTDATIVSAEWLNMMQEEGSNLVTDGGLVLDKADRTQWSQAVRAIATNVSGAYVLKAGDTMSGNLVMGPGSVGISYPGAHGGTNTFAFEWTGTGVNVWIDGAPYSNLVTGGPYVLRAGDTMSGNLVMGAGSVGIAYPGVSGAGNYFAFSWNGQLNVWVDGTLIGPVVTGGPFVLKTGDTMSGDLTAPNLNAYTNVTAGALVWSGGSISATATVSGAEGYFTGSMTAASGNMSAIQGTGQARHLAAYDPTGASWAGSTIRVGAHAAAAWELTADGAATLYLRPTNNAAIPWIFDQGGNMSTPGTIRAAWDVSSGATVTGRYVHALSNANWDGSALRVGANVPYCWELLCDTTSLLHLRTASGGATFTFDAGGNENVPGAMTAGYVRSWGDSRAEASLSAGLDISCGRNLGVNGAATIIGYTVANGGMQVYNAATIDVQLTMNGSIVGNQVGGVLNWPNGPVIGGWVNALGQSGTSIDATGYNGACFRNLSDYWNRSSYRDDLRSDVVPFDVGLEAILQMEPKMHGYAPETGVDAAVRLVGLDMDIIEQVLPQAVTIKEIEADLRNAELYDRRMVDPTWERYAMLNAIKTLHARVQALEATRARAA